MSESVRTGLASQFGIWSHADLCIRFHLERSPEQQQEQRQEEAGAAEGERTSAPERQFVGDPLPAHTVILILASPFLKARLEKACWKRMAAGACKRLQDGVAAGDAVGSHLDKRQRVEGVPTGVTNGSEGGCDRGAVSSLPEVLVPLSSEAEVPFARQAIEYIYTGSINADLGFEALLRVRQQACYLGVKHCPQACDQAMLAWLQAGKEQGQQQQHEGAGNSAGSPAAADLRVLQAYACRFLFPEPGTSPDAASFKPVRSTLAQQLVSHFGDAVAALTRPDLYRQLLQLPAVAVRELLAADDFGTDSEDTVFLLLACWLEANKRAVSAATRAELCGLVRLHRLSSTYLKHVLPAYEAFDISRAELDFLLRYVAADGKEREDMLEGDPRRRLSPWYCSPARRQSVPQRGRTMEWSISREQLEHGLRKMVESKRSAHVTASFGTFAAACAPQQPARALSCGILFKVVMRLAPAVMDPQGEDGAAGSGAAGIWVGCNVSRLYGEVTGSVAVDARVAVQKLGGETGWSRRRSRSAEIGSGHGWTRALRLQPAVPAAAGPAVVTASTGSGSGGAAGAGGAGGGGGNGDEAGEQQPPQQRQGQEQAQQQEQEQAQQEQAQVQGQGQGHGQGQQQQGQGQQQQVQGQQQQVQGQQGQGQVDAEVAAQLARFSEWLQDGKITGRITLYMP